MKQLRDAGAIPHGQGAQAEEEQSVMNDAFTILSRQIEWRMADMLLYLIGCEASADVICYVSEILLKFSSCQKDLRIANPLFYFHLLCHFLPFSFSTLCILIWAAF